VGFIDDDGIVTPEKTVALGLHEEDAVGHYLDVRMGTASLVETDLVGHGVAQFLPQLLGDPAGDGRRGHPPGLSAADQAPDAPSCLNAHLRQLGGFAGTSFPRNDQHPMLADCRNDLFSDCGNGKLGRITRSGS